VPLPPKPGTPARYDYEYQRNGTCNLFMFCEPQAGWRQIAITAQRTKLDFAEHMRWLVDSRYPAAEVIRVVLDNLNTHKPAALYEAFAPAEARRILKKLEFHYTPKHGSWLNMAEIELSILQRQCLGRRIPDEATLTREITAYEAARIRPMPRLHGDLRLRLHGKNCIVCIHQIQNDGLLDSVRQCGLLSYKTARKEGVAYTLSWVPGKRSALSTIHFPRTKSLCIPRRETDENVCPHSNSSRWESARCFRLGRQSCQRHPRPSLGGNAQGGRHTGGNAMDRSFCFVPLFAATLTLAASTVALAQVDPAALVKQHVDAIARGDAAGALALYADDAVLDGPGLCAAAPCVGKAAIQKELERRVAAKQRGTILKQYVSGNVLTQRVEARNDAAYKAGVERYIGWDIVEVKGDKIAYWRSGVLDRSDPQTARFDEWQRAQPPAK
jgi:ketosteroid isomerase-like protein/transposase